MQPNFTLKKQTQISEEAQPPVHVPLMLGNDCYVLTQQDFRKIEDSRLLSVSKLMENGDLKPLEKIDAESLLQILKLNFLEPQTCQISLNLFNLLNGKSNVCSDAQQMQHQLCPQPYVQCQPDPKPMEISSCPIQDSCKVGYIEQQLRWDKCNNTSAPFPMTYSQGTSTTDVGTSANYKMEQNIQTCCSCCCCPSCRSKHSPKKVAFSKGTYTQDIENCSKKPTENLGAREELKQKKLNYVFDFIS